MSKGELTALPGEEIVSPVTVKVGPKYAKSEYWPLEKLSLWDKNPRSIKEDRFKELKARLSRQGQVKPLLVTKNGTVIGGNMRLRAITDLNWDKVWVSVTEAVTDKEIFDLALTDNEEFGYYEQEQLAELALSIGLSPLELKTYEVSLGETTTLDLVVDKFGPEDVQEDEVPEVDETGEPESRVGEVYQLGRHRVMCGNSADVSDIEKLLDGAQPDFVFTDPPYQLETQGGGLLKESSAMKGIRDLGIDTFDPSTLTPLAQTSVFCCNKPLVPQYITLAQKWGVSWDLCVYHKQNITPNYGGHLMTDLEYLLVLGNQAPITGQDKSLYSKLYSGGKDQDNETAWSKPVSLCAKFIQLYAKPRSIVADTFGGSGSTLIACEQTNRTCYMMELDPKYVDVIRKRYANHIGEGDRWQDVTPAVKELVNASR